MNPSHSAAVPTKLRVVPTAASPSVRASPNSWARMLAAVLALAGDIGVDSHTGNAPTDPATEARLVMEATYRSYFHGHDPARAFIGDGKLLRGGRFEVQGAAVKGTP